MSCSVKGCGNYYRKTKLLDGNSIKYFSFPKDFTIAIKWLAVCGKQNVNIKKAMICSQHFDASCFIQPSKEKSLFYSQKRQIKLRPDAIPTLRLMIDEPQVEAVHCDNRSLPLIDTSDMSALPSTSEDVTALLEKLNSVEEQLATTQKELLMYKEKERNMETRMYKVLEKMFTPGKIQMLLNSSNKNCKMI